MGYIEICESGSAVDCYVQKAGSDLSAFMSAGSDVFTLLFGALALAASLLLARWIHKKVRL